MNKTSLTLIIFLLVSYVSSMELIAQKSHKKLKLSGFTIVVMPSKDLKYLTSGKAPVQEQTDKDLLTLTAMVKPGDKRNTLRLFASDLESLELENCELMLSNPIFKNLKLHLHKGSTVTMNAVKMNILNVGMDAESKLFIDGVVATMDAEIKGASLFNSTDLAVDNLNLNISSASNSDLTLIANNISINAGYASNVLLNGRTENIDIVADMAVVIDARKLEANTGKASNKRGCLIYVNIAKMAPSKDIDVIENIFGREQIAPSKINVQDIM